MLGNDHRSIHYNLHWILVIVDMETGHGLHEKAYSVRQTEGAPRLLIFDSSFHVQHSTWNEWKCLELLTYQSLFPGMFLSTVSKHNKVKQINIVEYQQNQ